ncbi:hypothetical protein HHK36_020552 [Tetracentron sinense]|uniref:Sec-independent protein translocase protein TATA, chloroplastic n=1 Tax=Tetracentron sinense TaxID=13715 RepID=A0A834YRT3_TETSI|nr:hypothetical protein HHK36_020552 [Tetracentron sinense]
MAISATLSLSSIPRTLPSVSLASSNSAFFSTDLLNKTKKSNSLVFTRTKSQRGLNCKCLFGLGVPEIVVIAGVAALLFGPKNLPEVGRSIGKTIKSFQQAAKEFESELKKEPAPAIESPAEKPTAVSEEEVVSSTKESL